MKKFLMLGTGVMQAPAIIEAKKLACTVIAVDQNPNSASVHLVDRFEQIDLKDTEALVAFAKKLKAEEGLDAVFTAATDFSYAVARIAEACDLPGHTPEAALNASDKMRMRECFAKHRLSSPLFIEVNEESKESAPETMRTAGFNFPIVVKPVDNMGARGCKLVHSQTELADALESAINFSRTRRAIAEEFVQGSEFSMEAIVFNGEVHVTAIAERHIHFAPYFVEMGHTIPAKIDDSTIYSLCCLFTEGVRALGLTHGAAKGDIFFDGTKAVIGEIAARLSGGYMSGWTVPYAYGFNVTKACVQLALGEEPTAFTQEAHSFNFQKKAQVCAERAWLSIPGRLASVTGIKTAKSINGVVQVIPRYRIGDTLFFPKNNVEKAGNIIAVADTHETAIELCRKAIAEITFRLEANNAETESFLDALNDSTRTQHEYPPNCIGLSNCEVQSFKELFAESEYCTWNGLLLPEKLVELFPYAKDTSDIPLADCILKALNCEGALVEWIRTRVLEREKKPTAADELNRLWCALIRGGTQGLLYVYDSTN